MLNLNSAGQNKVEPLGAAILRHQPTIKNVVVILTKQNPGSKKPLDPSEAQDDGTRLSVVPLREIRN